MRTDDRTAKLDTLSKLLLALGIIACVGWVALIIRARIVYLDDFAIVGETFAAAGFLSGIGAWLRYKIGFLLVLGICAVLEGIFGLVARKGSTTPLMVFSIIGIIVSLGMLVLIAIVGGQPLGALALVPAALSVVMLTFARR